MLESKKAIIFAAVFLTCAIGYNIVHFTQKRTSPTRTTPSSESPTAQKASIGLPLSQDPISLDVDKLADLLEDLRGNTRLLDVPSLVRPPFMNQGEQKAKETWQTTLERQRREAEATRNAQFARRGLGESNVEALIAPQQLQSVTVNLKAVIVSKDPKKSLALIEGRMLHIGDVLPGSSVKILKIQTHGIEISDGVKTRWVELDS